MLINFHHQYYCSLKMEALELKSVQMNDIFSLDLNQLVRVTVKAKTVDAQKELTTEKGK